MTELGNGVDGAVRRIEHTYEVRGMVAHTTSYDNPNVGQGNVVNDVFDEYDEWGLLAKGYQAHDGPVNTLTTPYVGYDYADAADGLRLESVRYPNGRILDYLYNSGIDDILNRPSALADSDETHLAEYTYLGLGNILGVTYPEPGVTNDPTLNGYEALDRFGRTAEVLWKKTASPFAPVVDLKYGYNAAGNRTYRQDVVAGANYLDELYEYDDVDQLIDVKRGQLDLSDPENIHIDNQDVAHSQNWNLDALGNWDTVTTGTTPQDRAHNATNELTTADGWVASTYDLNGNMLTMPQPGNPASAYNLKWDAWNRLVKVTTGSGETEETVAEYVYDGQNRRIEKKTYTEGELSETRHFYQSAENQVVEERLDSREVADQQYVWGLRYIDDLVLRDRDSDHDGVATEGSYGKTDSGLDEGHYAIQDGNWNVVAVVDVSGSVVERYAYSAYGKVEILEDDFDPKTSDLIDWTVLYTGRDLDLETGLQYSRARYYGADLGRFLGRDPIEYKGGMNLYEYAKDAPTNNTDPTGTTTIAPILPSGGNWKDTGLKFCNGTLHGFIKLTDGVGYGFYACSHIGGQAGILDDLATIGVVDGVVVNDDARVYKDATCYSIYVNANCWDVKCYARKVEEWVRQDYGTYNRNTTNRRCYNVGVNNCYTWRNRAAGLYGSTGIYGPDLSECRTGGFFSCLWAGLGIQLVSDSSSGGIIMRK